MSGTLTAPKTVARRRASVTHSPAAIDHSAMEVSEERRWLVPLVSCFTLAAAFFAAAVGSGRVWLIGPAGICIGLIIIWFVYLGLSSDTNGSD